MLETFAKILPLAIASAASPVILGVSIALLSRKNFGSALAFLAGGLVVALILAAVGMSIAANDDKVAEGMGRPPTVIDLAVGVLFLLFGAKILLEKPSEKKEIQTAGKGMRHHAKWFFIGFVGNLTNFDAVLLNLAAIREIFNSSIATMPKLELLGFCDFFFLLPALAPIAAYLIAPQASQKVLLPVGNAMNRYGKYVVGAIFILFGIYEITRWT
ncbi:MAG: GAP family protein [Candidatus Micrarchaeota archaeon]|nr:GAP family protein [Candidatus Micrarchaeota archaeon]